MAVELTKNPILRYIGGIALIALLAGSFLAVRSASNNNTIVQAWQTSDGRTKAYITSSGSLALSGSVIINGTSITSNIYTGGQGINVTGQVIKLNATLSGATLSGSTVRYNQLSPRIFMAEVFGSGSNVATGSGKVHFAVPSAMSGFNVTSVDARVITAGVTNSSTFKVRNLTKGNRQILSTPVSIDSTKIGSDTAATPYVINAALNNVSGNDILAVDVSSVSTTAPKGLLFSIVLTKP